MDYNLRKRIERIAGTLYGQITSEADMVYGEWMLERGKEVSIHLPENSTEEEVESAVLVVFQALKWQHGDYRVDCENDSLTVSRTPEVAAIEVEGFTDGVLNILAEQERELAQAAEDDDDTE